MRFLSPSLALIADTICRLSAFVESNAQLLLDISLYVSYENYSTKTRSAFTRILPWYANYTLPTVRRTAARARTEHLGVSSLDIDNVHEDVIDKPQSLNAKTKGQNTFEHETEQRAKTLLGKRETIRSMLQKPEYAGAFRLKNLADAFFEPLQAFLAEKEYLLDTGAPTSLDYLAYGYLSLMLYPHLVQNWLSDAMRKKYSRLASYVERISSYTDTQVDDKTISALFQKQSSDESGSMQGNVRSGLPWTRPQAQGLLSIVSHISNDLLRRVPIIGSSDQLSELATKDHDETVFGRYLPGLVGLVSTAMALGGYWIYQNEIWPRGEAVQIFGRKRLTDYGEAGSALAALSNQLRYESAYQQQQVNPVQVDVVVKDEPGP